MIIEQSTETLVRSRRPLASEPIVAIVGGSLLIGVILGASVTAQLARPGAGDAAALNQPSATFDAVRFRAEERLSWAGPQATFDAVRFRAEERGPLDP